MTPPWLGGTIGKEVGSSPPLPGPDEYPRPLNVVPIPAADDLEPDHFAEAMRKQARADVAATEARKEAADREAAEVAERRREAEEMADRITNRFCI